jgi:hypothetical protein
MPNLENKERILKASREKCQIACKCKHVRITSNFPAQTLKARKA